MGGDTAPPLITALRSAEPVVEKPKPSAAFSTQLLTFNRLDYPFPSTVPANNGENEA